MGECNRWYLMWYEKKNKFFKGLMVILANCEFEGPPCVCVCSGSVFNWHCSLLNQRPKQACVIQLADERKRRRSLSRGMSWELRKNFFLASGNPSFPARADCAFSQKPAGKLLLLYLFYFVFILLFILLSYCFILISYSIPPIINIIFFFSLIVNEMLPLNHLI